MAQSGRASEQAGAVCFIAGFGPLSTLPEVGPACSSADAAVTDINRAATSDFPDRLMRFTASAPLWRIVSELIAPARVAQPLAPWLVRPAMLRSKAPALTGRRTPLTRACEI